MAEPLSAEELKELLHKLRMEAFDLVRQGEALYREKYANRQLNEEEWIQVLIENPSLMQRPIIVKGEKAIIARPPEKVFELL